MNGSGDTGEMSAQIQRMSFRHGVPEARLREILDDGRKTPPDFETAQNYAESLRRLDRSLEIGGTSAWIRRVDSAFGAEALFDEEFRFLAVSRAGRTISSVSGVKLELPRTIFVGTRYASLLPSNVSFLDDSYPGFEGLRDKGFFRGKMLGLQVDLEMNFGFHFIRCIMEVWAIRTPDRGVLGHSQIHSQETKRPSLATPGVQVYSVSYL